MSGDYLLQQELMKLKFFDDFSFVVLMYIEMQILNNHVILHNDLQTFLIFQYNIYTSQHHIH